MNNIILISFKEVIYYNHENGQTFYKKSINFRIKEKKNERIHKKEQSKFGNNVML